MVAENISCAPATSFVANVGLVIWLFFSLTSVPAQEPRRVLNQSSSGATAKRLSDAVSVKKWREIEVSVDRGLAFLASQQTEDGSFPTIRSGQPGVTSLCIMAFLSRGHQPGGGKYGERLNRAIDYTIRCQRSDGLFSLDPPGLEWQRYE